MFDKYTVYCIPYDIQRTPKYKTIQRFDADGAAARGYSMKIIPSGKRVRRNKN